MWIDDDQVCFRIQLVLPTGERLESEYTWADVARGEYPRWPFEGEPHWLLRPESHWRGPLEPHEFNGHVPESMVDYARRLMAER